MKHFINIKTIASTLLSSSLLLSGVNFAYAQNAQGYNELQDDLEFSEQVEYSEAELAQILAPVALYPDSLLAHILVAASYPLDLVQAHRFVEDNQELSTDALMEEAESMNWDPSIVALLGFPEVLAQMNDELEWTISLGTAFIGDEAAVLASIQDLRQDAQAANSLNNLAHMKVTNVNNHIYIAPRQQQKVYVPIYNPYNVYGNWRYASHKPFAWNATLRLNLSPNIRISWGSRIGVNFDFFFGAFNWSSRHAVFTNHRGSKRYVNPYKIAKNRYAKPYKFSAKRLQHNHRKVYVKTSGKGKRYAVVNKHRTNKQYKNTKQFDRSRNKQVSNNKGLVRKLGDTRTNGNSLERSQFKGNKFEGNKKAIVSRSHSKNVVNKQHTADNNRGKQTVVKQRTVVTQKKTVNNAGAKQQFAGRQQASQQRTNKQQRTNQQQRQASSKGQRNSSSKAQRNSSGKNKQRK